MVPYAAQVWGSSRYEVVEKFQRILMWLEALLNTCFSYFCRPLNCTQTIVPKLWSFYLITIQE